MNRVVETKSIHVIHGKGSNLVNFCRHEGILR